MKIVMDSRPDAVDGPAIPRTVLLRTVASLPFSRFRSGHYWRANREAAHPFCQPASHTLSAEARDKAASTSLRLLIVLSVLSEYASAR